MSSQTAQRRTIVRTIAHKFEDMLRTFVHLTSQYVLPARRGRFLSPLAVLFDFSDPARPVRLVRPLEFETRRGRIVSVPAGFASDLASIPRIIRPLIGKLERHAPAAVLHDWLYRAQTVTRAKADRLFLDAMAVMGVGRLKRLAMFAAVRLSGAGIWRRYFEENTMAQPIKGAAKPASPDTVARVAREIIGCSPAALEAVIKVETPGFGFDPDGYLVLLPELHKLPRYLPKDKRRAAKRAGLWRRKWSPAQYRGLSSYRRDPARAGRQRRALWGRIAALDERTAYLVTSWGLPQMMGFNYRLAGYDSVEAMIRAFADSEDAQIEAMGRFIRARGLDDELRALDWRGFARGYNGPGQVSRYAAWLEREYARAQMSREGPADPAASLRPQALTMGMEGEAVHALQKRLTELGYNVDADGDFGPETKFALQRFQHENGLASDGIAGPKTWAALEDAPEREASQKPLADLVRQDSRVQSGIGQAVTGIAAGTAVAVEKIAANPPGPGALEQAGKMGQQALDAITPWTSLINLVSGNLKLALIAFLAAGGVWVAARGIKAHRARRWFG